MTDVVDPVQGYPISDNGKPYNGDIPQIIALDLNKGTNSRGFLDTGGFVWGIDVEYETPIDALLFFSSKPGVGAPALFMADRNGLMSYESCIGFEEPGITYAFEDGLFTDQLIGLKAHGGSGYKPSDLLDPEAPLTDFLDEGHDPAQDTFYTMSIPLASLGLSKAALEAEGIGVMHISTFGQSGIGSLPMDMSMLDNALAPYSADESTSAEKEDLDLITQPLARLGKAAAGEGSDEEGGSDTGITKQLLLNFGADKSSPQPAGKALILRAEAEGGEGKLSYVFEADGKILENEGKTADNERIWLPESGRHNIKVTLRDELGHQLSLSKVIEIDE